ncbi:nucleotidyltransferase family protein [Chryseobacterium luquanense]|uniref:Nucleotidyltransferase family protein n=1 Tax=Chryseobacterium luquanense TaxID=2983766 RepID=A0ABT3XXW8_9FLAO|nr:nucleotidyltransferase family protein [Chryseobacterium luquanense]MCX8530744.1 nucleotidyltransferase family protein [Chryseobacterium luquanense]
METGILILAAGNSSRLGQPKQLLDFKGKSLLRNVAEESLKITKSVVVVTGANSIEISKEINDLKLIITENRIWNEGMGSSIHIGFDQLLNSFPAIENCIVSVCDQPFIEASLFSDLIQMQQDFQKGIVASKYADTLGTPVLFTKKYFTDLSKLSGKEGAKKLLQKFKDDIAEINFEKGAIDIDTQNDYQQLIQ